MNNYMFVILKINSNGRDIIIIVVGLYAPFFLLDKLSLSLIGLSTRIITISEIERLGRNLPNTIDSENSIV